MQERVLYIILYSILYDLSVTFTLKVMQQFVYGYPSSSVIVEAHFIYDRLLYYLNCKFY